MHHMVYFCYNVLVYISKENQFKYLIKLNEILPKNKDWFFTTYSQNNLVEIRYGHDKII